MLTKGLVATVACLSLSVPGVTVPEPAEGDFLDIPIERPESVSFDRRLHQFADELRENLGIKEGEIDDSTENFLLKHKLLFLLFGLLFCWMTVVSLSKN
ncbi:MAG: hypothetical protein ACFB4I_17740 [Cyanophyceae cyanobacterium]